MSRFEKAHPEDRDGRWAAQTSAVTGFVAGIFKDANGNANPRKYREYTVRRGLRRENRIRFQANT